MFEAKELKIRAFYECAMPVNFYIYFRQSEVRHENSLYVT